MEEIISRLTDLSNDLIDDGHVSYGDNVLSIIDMIGQILYSDPERIPDWGPPVKMYAAPISNDPKHIELLDMLASTLVSLVSKYVPDDEKDNWLDALLEYEEYTNEY